MSAGESYAASQVFRCGVRLKLEAYHNVSQ